jgi:hypothetical protein
MVFVKEELTKYSRFGLNKPYAYSIDLRSTREAVALSCSWQEVSSQSWVQIGVPWEGWPQLLDIEKISFSTH